MPQPKLLISIAILVVIALHVIPIVYAPERKTLWPILEWSMYKDAHEPGPVQGHRRRITGITSQGKEQPITSILVGSSGFALNALYFRPMWNGDTAAAQHLFGRLNRQREDPFVEFRVQSETYTVTDTGVARQEWPVITYRADPSPSR